MRAYRPLTMNPLEYGWGLPVQAAPQLGRGWRLGPGAQAPALALPRLNGLRHPPYWAPVPCEPGSPSTCFVSVTVRPPQIAMSATAMSAKASSE